MPVAPAPAAAPEEEEERQANAMIALFPADPEALVVDGGLAADDLHVTCMFLGVADAYDDDRRDGIVRAVNEAAAAGSPIQAEASGIVIIGKNDEGQPAVCLLLESQQLMDAWEVILDKVKPTAATEQGGHPTFIPHLTLGYGLDPTSDEVASKVGKTVVLDRLGAKFGDELFDFRIGDPVEEEEEPVEEEEEPVEKEQPREVVAAAGDDFEVDPDTGEWHGVLIVEGLPSGDGRQIQPGALDWRNLPLPLMVMFRNPDGGAGHAAAEICGRIDWMERRESATDGVNEIWGGGVFDLGSEAGMEARRLVGERILKGVSADLCDMEVEWENPPPEDADLEELFDFDPGLMFVVQGRAMGATLCGFPAFEEAELFLGPPPDPDVQAESEEALAASACACRVEEDADRYATLVAAAGPGLNGSQGRTWLPIGVQAEGLVAAASESSPWPVHPPAAWFAKPKLDGPIPLRVTKEGRIYGHVSTWGSCHTGWTTQGRCVPVPRGDGKYAAFRNKETLTAEGQMVATGPLLIDTVHPTLRRHASDALVWYHETGCGAGDVALYDDEWGIVAAGAVRPGVPHENVRRMRGSDVSPDWRPLQPGGPLELIALLAVNVSGFITPALVASAGPGWVRPGDTRVSVDLGSGEVQAIVGGPGPSRSPAPFDPDVIEALGDLRQEVARLGGQLRTIRHGAARARIERLRQRA